MNKSIFIVVIVTAIFSSFTVSGIAQDGCTDIIVGKMHRQMDRL